MSEEICSSSLKSIFWGMENAFWWKNSSEMGFGIKKYGLILFSKNVSTVGGQDWKCAHSCKTIRRSLQIDRVRSLFSWHSCNRVECSRTLPLLSGCDAPRSPARFRIGLSLNRRLWHFLFRKDARRMLKENRWCQSDRSFEALTRRNSGLLLRQN